MSKLQLIILSLLLVGGLTACKIEDIDAPSKLITYNSNINTIEAYTKSTGLSSLTTSSGLYFVITPASSSPAVSSTVTPDSSKAQELEFTYTLSVLSSTTIASTTAIIATVVDSASKTKPVFMPFVSGILKAGLEEGLKRMHEGDKAIFLMPSILAYGDVVSSVPPIPANSAVRFDVTLNRIRTESQQIREYMAANKMSPDSVTADSLRFFRTKSNPTAMTVAEAQSKNLEVKFNYKAKQLHAKTAVGFDSTGSNALNLYNVVGFAEGIKKLREGETGTFLFPSTIGYGVRGSVNNGVFTVAPYAPLRYDVEVVSIK